MTAEQFEHDDSTLHDRFVDQALRHPSHKCMADATKALNYREALIRARVVQGLLSDKLHADDRYDKMVGVLMPASVDAALVNIALGLMGRVPVNLNFTAGDKGICSALRQCEIKQVIASKLFMEKIKLQLEGVELIYSEELTRNVSGWRKFTAALPVFLPALLANSIIIGSNHRTGDQLATVIFSSGSTGEPKGVMLSHASLIFNLRGFAELCGMTESDCVVGIPPLFHASGYTGSLWLSLVIGSSVAFQPNPLDAKGLGALTLEQQGTILLSTPTFLRHHLRGVLPEQFASLRAVIVGAEKLPEKVANAFHEKFGVYPLEGYGMTELAPLVSVNQPDLRDGDTQQVRRKPGTVGRPIPGIDMRIVDPESGDALPHGQAGLLLVRGPNLMMGYLHKEELTKEKIKDGWYDTSDIGMLDEDGFITITGRLSRFSKIGGEMVPHGRVEELLHEMADQTELTFAVCAFPDTKKGERLVVLHKKTDQAPRDLCAKLRDAGMPNIYIPSSESFFEVEELPVLGTGKLDLKGLKEMAAKMDAKA